MPGGDIANSWIAFLDVSNYNEAALMEAIKSLEARWRSKGKI